MNFEETQNKGYEEPRKPGRSWFAFCGIGCLILLLICGAGSIIAWFTMGDYIKMGFDQATLHAETMQLVMESESVQAKLGEPVTVDGFAFPSQKWEGDTLRQTYKMDLKGPKGNGELVIEYLMEPGKGVSRTKFDVIIDGQTINLLESDEFNLPNIDDGMEGGDMDEAEEEIILEDDEVPAGAANDG